MSSRAILHADLDAFYASVEQRDDPALRGIPVVVGGGVVLAASYEARAFGVRSAMGGSERRRRCPQAIVVPCRFDAYAEASRAVFAIFNRSVPHVQKVSIDEAFLDVTALGRPPREIAEELRAAVRAEVGLPISVGAATSRAVAKVASGAAKPDGLVVVEPGTEARFLGPLKVEALWGVGAATARRLHDAGIVTVAQLAELEEAAVMSVLGVAVGRQLHAVAHGWDPGPALRRGPRRRTMGAQSALGRGGLSPAALEERLAQLVERVAARLRKGKRVGGTVTLRLRFSDFTRATRSRTLRHPTGETRPLLAAARTLLAGALPLILRRGVTLIGITIGDVHADAGGLQLELPLEAAGEGPAAALGGA